MTHVFEKHIIVDIQPTMYVGGIERKLRNGAWIIPPVIFWSCTLNQNMVTSADTQPKTSWLCHLHDRHIFTFMKKKNEGGEGRSYLVNN